ncbi:hypothetical protein [Sinomonas sp.]|uniref:hypothetical protein n=1 Tax=Sinomonas sp. TaxID=1914986 RepID=UPI002CFDAF3D|nr:hypothetical protein [Sinomonas sp.]
METERALAPSRLLGLLGAEDAGLLARACRARLWIASFIGATALVLPLRDITA